MVTFNVFWQVGGYILEKILEKVTDFIFDIKNILSIGALVLLFQCVNLGIISGENAFAVILMTFTYFLGANSKKKEVEG